MILLPAALALVCSFSEPLCDVATSGRVEIVSGSPHDTHGQPVYGQWNNARLITINSSLSTPVGQAIALTHELTHVADGPPSAGRDCGAYERSAYQAQAQFLTWYRATVGPPDLRDKPADLELWTWTVLAPLVWDRPNAFPCQ